MSLSSIPWQLFVSAVTSWISRRMNHGPWETGYKLCIELARRGGGSEIHIQKVHIKTSLRNWIKKYGGVTNLCEKSRNKLGLSCAKPMLSNFFKIHSSFPIFSRFTLPFQFFQDFLRLFKIVSLLGIFQNVIYYTLNTFINFS